MKQIGEFTLLDRLGKGADGDVWKVQDQHQNLYALKFCPVSETNSDFHTEFQRLKRIKLMESSMYIIVERKMDLHTIPWI